MLQRKQWRWQAQQETFITSLSIMNQAAHVQTIRKEINASTLSMHVQLSIHSSPTRYTNSSYCKQVLHNVLKAPENLQYQLAFLSSELRDIFAQAPPIPSATPSAENADSEHPSNRKAVDGDCPICFMAFEPASEEIVWCKAACGNNIHKDCFEQWATSRAGAEVKCVYWSVFTVTILLLLFSFKGM